MITNEEQLRQSVDQLGRMYRALTALRTEVLPLNTRQYAVMAEGPLDEIQRLQAEIDAYTGIAIPEQDVAEQVETHTGELRAIDLDNFSFILRNAGEVQEIRCTFDDELLESAKRALDRRVLVTGSRHFENGRRTYATLRVTRLEVLDDQNTDKTEGKFSNAEIIANNKPA
jgi:hypothetical protein